MSDSNDIKPLVQTPLSSFVDPLAAKFQELGEYHGRLSESRELPAAIQCQMVGRAEAYLLVASIMREWVHPTVPSGVTPDPVALASGVQMLMQMNAQVSSTTRASTLAEYGIGNKEVGSDT